MPLGPADKEDICKINVQLELLIQELENGKHNVGRLFYIGQQLQILSASQHIPDNVKLKLKSALKEIQTESLTHVALTQVVHAQKEIDDVLNN